MVVARWHWEVAFGCTACRSLAKTGTYRHTIVHGDRYMVGLEARDKTTNPRVTVGGAWISRGTTNVSCVTLLYILDPTVVVQQ